MKKGFNILLIVLFIFIIASLISVYSADIGEDEIRVKELKIMDKEKPEYASDEILVKFKIEVLPERVEEIFSEFNVTKISEIEKLKIHRLKIPSNITVQNMINRFKKNPLIEYAEPNYYVYASFVPNDPLYSYQWHFDNPVYGGIHMEDAWDITAGNPSVIVAILDTGVAYENYPGQGFWHLDNYNAYGSSGYSWWSGVNQSLYSWTALYGSSSTPPGYGNGWKEYLQHTFDLTSAIGIVTFSYFYKLDIERNFDFFYVEISNDNGQSWTELKKYTNRVGGLCGRGIDWTSDSINLTSYKGNKTLIRFRFNSDETWSDEDGNCNTNGAVYIDEIKLEDSSGTIFYDNFNDGLPDLWETTRYKLAPDLVGTSFIAGYDFVNNDSHANDDEAHGTHVTGTVAQTTNNNLGVAGVAFNTSIMPVKVLNAAGTGTHAMIADGIIYATNNGADIISMSLGGPTSSTMQNAVNYAYNNGVTVIAACGNSNANSCDYPAAYNNVIAVGATQYDETKAPYSSYGSTLDLVAPGGNTGVDQNMDGYGDGVLQQTFSDTPVDFAYWFYQGTSMATPHVSGVAALLLALNSSLTSDDIRNVLQSTAEDLGSPGRDNTFGWGLVNASAAVNNVTPPGEFISITLFNYPIDFSNKDPATTDNSGIGNPYKVRIDTETTVNVDLYQKGDNFVGNPSVLGIGNMSWLNSNNSVSSYQMSSTYGNNISNITPGTNVSIFYWLDIPQGQTGGNYNTTINIKAVKIGTFP